MAVETRYAVLDDVGLVFFQRAGAFELGEFVAFMRSFAEGPDFVPGRDYLVDQRRMTYPVVRYQDLTARAHLWQAAEPVIGKCRMAFVHDRDGHYGTGRMNAAAFSSETIERRPFRDMASALRWLGLSPELRLPELF